MSMIMWRGYNDMKEMQMFVRELYWAIKTRRLVKGWSVLRYFIWRMDRRFKKGHIIEDMEHK